MVAVESLHESSVEVVSVVEVLEAVVGLVTPEEEELQIGQHFGSQPLSSKLSTRRLRRRSERAYRSICQMLSNSQY